MVTTDLVVLVGCAGEDNCCSGSNLALIVAVAVVVPVAVLFVLAIIVALLLIYFQCQKCCSSLHAMSDSPTNIMLCYLN